MDAVPAVQLQPKIHSQLKLSDRKVPLYPAAKQTKGKVVRFVRLMNEFAVLVTWCLKWHPKAFTLKTERRYNDYIDHYPCSSISSTCTEPFLVLKIGWFWLKLKGLSGTLFLLCFTGKLVELMVQAISTSL